jgi:hypothetical protein
METKEIKPVRHLRQKLKTAKPPATGWCDGPMQFYSTFMACDTPYWFAKITPMNCGKIRWRSHGDYIGYKIDVDEFAFVVDSDTSEVWLFSNEKLYGLSEDVGNPVVFLQIPCPVRAVRTAHRKSERRGRMHANREKENCKRRTAAHRKQMEIANLRADIAADQARIKEIEDGLVAKLKELALLMVTA